MTIILAQEIILSTVDNQKNSVIPFHLERGYQRLIIEFSYGPQLVEEEVALLAIQKALPLFFKEPSKVECDQFMPLVNLITLSLSHNQKYIGCRHNKQNQQRILISEKGSSLGYLAEKVTAGDWEIQLNNHCVLSQEVRVSLVVYGEEGDAQ